ncbi:hypothetical protein CR513_31160, partial [Mucuna pruriens]
MAKTKIDIHAGILSMEFGNTFVKFNIFEALKHLTKSANRPHQLTKRYSTSIIKYRVKAIAQTSQVCFLGDHQQFLEEKLLEVLRKHKKAIGWTLANLPRINPSIFMHKILLEEDAYPIRQ